MSIVLEKTRRRPRAPLDRYNTPQEFVEAGLALIEGCPYRILDVGAGEGIWGAVAREKWRRSWITGVEISPSRIPDAYTEWVIDDFLARTWEDPFHLVMGNPPFNLAEAIIRHSLDLLDFGGVCVFLLRLAFLESQTRAKGLFREYPPEMVSVCSSRPRFYGEGSGATAFCYIVFRNGHKGETNLAWSQITPAKGAVRKVNAGVASENPG